MIGSALSAVKVRTLAWIVVGAGLVASCSVTTTNVPALSSADFSAAVVSGSAEETPQLISAREEAVATLRGDLPQSWGAATRGLGMLTIVSDNPGIVITVLAANGDSFLKGGVGTNQTPSITIYVADLKGRLEGIDLVPTAIHELGHIWCCYGPGTSGDGHWAVPQDDGRQYGLNRWGLMNHPVLCHRTSAGSNCPDRFSDRELQALGFSSFPAPTPDPCVAEADQLKANLKSVEAELLSNRRVRDDLTAQAASLRATLDLRDPASVARYNAPRGRSLAKTTKSVAASAYSTATMSGTSDTPSGGVTTMRLAMLCPACASIASSTLPPDPLKIHA